MFVAYIKLSNKRHIGVATLSLLPFESCDGRRLVKPDLRRFGSHEIRYHRAVIVEVSLNYLSPRAPALTPPRNTPLGKPHGARHSARKPKWGGIQAGKALNPDSGSALVA